MEIFNKFLVASQGDNLVFMRPLPQKLSYDDALLLAAWLKVMAEPFTSEKFDDIEKAVCAS